MLSYQIYSTNEQESNGIMSLTFDPNRLNRDDFNMINLLFKKDLDPEYLIVPNGLPEVDFLFENRFSNQTQSQDDLITKILKLVSCRVPMNVIANEVGISKNNVDSLLQIRSTSKSNNLMHQKIADVAHRCYNAA